MIRAKDVTTWGAQGKSAGVERVSNGFRLGKMLAKKLQVRNDDTKTQYNRQRKGKIDRRLLADLGLGNNKIFEQSFITKASDAGIHISIDASGSMNGTRFENALTTAIAIAVAMDMVGGIRVRIDVRSESESYGLVPGQSSYTPTVLVAYDSRVNNLTHIRKYFPKLCTSGGTPEGICFRAIEKLIMAGNNNTDKYFINLSDGEPNGDAKEITKKAVKTLKKNQIKVLSYFVSEHTPSTRTKDTFDYMYGTDSTEYIETDNIFAIAKTINKLLSNRV
jgi:nitric oxide reductase activation protein